MELGISVAERLKQLRKENKTNQTDIAKITKISLNTYNRYENGLREPTIKVLIDLADYYHVTLDYLVGRNFASDMGYLSDIDREALENFKQLNAKNKTTMLAELRTAVLIQNSN